MVCEGSAKGKNPLLFHSERSEVGGLKNFLSNYSETS
jgi:hypothetical protein